MMRARLGILLLPAVAMAGCAAARSGEPVAVTIDAGEKHQTIAGFGGTIGWVYPKREKLDEVADLLFRDLGASIVRLSALSKNGDATDELSPEPENDNADPEAIDWKRFDFKACEAEQAALARAAAARGVEKFIAASWSPPPWMKESGSRRWGGALRPGMEKELAELWTAYLVWMKREGGVTLNAVAIQNEPEVSWSYPTASFSPEELDRAAGAFLTRMRREKEAPAAKLLWPEVSQLKRFEPYLRAGSEETLAGVSAITVHAYDLTVDYHDVDAYREQWRRTREMVAPLKKPLWMTEFSNYSGAFSGRNQGSWEEAMAWARHLHLALVEGECSAVLFWGLYFDKKGEALVYAARTGAEEYEVTPKFYTSKNYFRFIRPGAVRVASTPTEGKLEVSAFRHEARRELVAVCINRGEGPLTARFEMRGIDAPKSAEFHRTSRDEKCVKLDGSDWRALELPAGSVTTAVFKY